MTPEQRRLRARIAAQAKWANTPDRTAATAPARAGFRNKLAAEIDPDGQLAPDELARRVDHAQTAHLLRMSLRRSRAARGAAS